MGYFRIIARDIDYTWDEILLKIKHPTRPGDWRHFYDIWDHAVAHPWYCLKRGVGNLVRYFPVIWKTDVWDRFYLEDLMDKKLEEFEKFWKVKADEERAGYDWEPEKGWRCQYRRIYKRIYWTRKFMAMASEEYYAMKHYDDHQKAFPQSNNRLLKSEVSKCDAWGEPVLYTMKPMPEDERIAYRVGSKKAQEMDEKVFKLFIKNFSHLRDWWH